MSNHPHQRPKAPQVPPNGPVGPALPGPPTAFFPDGREAHVADVMEIVEAEYHGQPALVVQMLHSGARTAYPPFLIAPPNATTMAQIKDNLLRVGAGVPPEPLVEPVEAPEPEPEVEVPPPPTTVRCDACGRRIFGEVAATGRCTTCPSPADPPTVP